VTAWSWSFGDGGSSAQRSPSHAFAAAGSYAITLTATDDLGATRQASGAVTVSQAISLSVTARADATKQYMTLTWTGAAGATVDIYRNGKFLLNTPNDGKHVNTRTFSGAATYVYKVCEAGSTTCSNQASVTF
jgi:PKD repeat protein